MWDIRFGGICKSYSFLTMVRRERGGEGRGGKEGVLLLMVDSDDDDGGGVSLFVCRCILLLFVCFVCYY